MDREPVALAQAATAAVPAVVSALIALGVFDWDSDTEIRVVHAVLALVTVAVAAVGGWTARSRVTPLVRPRDNLGRRLVPVPGSDQRSSP